MRSVRRRDTSCEMAIRSELHRRGLRYRVDRAPLEGMRSRADLVFGPARVAVFVDGCFWHACPEHATWPQSNADWWKAKIEANVQRDVATNRRLEQAGWAVVRIWEHEDPVEAADRVEEIVVRRR